MWLFNPVILVSKHPAASQHGNMSRLKVSVFCRQFMSEIHTVIDRERHLRDAPNRAHCAVSMSRILWLISGPKFNIPNRADTSYYSWFSALFAGPAKCYPFPPSCDFLDDSARGCPFEDAKRRPLPPQPLPGHRRPLESSSTPSVRNDEACQASLL